jgi:hypothetical protein
VIKNLTSNQLLLIALAALLLLVAGFSFYLLQNPTAGLPFAPPPATSSPTLPQPTLTDTSLPTTQTPTRKTSYTPQAAFRTPSPYAPAQITSSLAASTPSTPESNVTPTKTLPAIPTVTQVGPYPPPSNPTQANPYPAPSIAATSTNSPAVTGSPTTPPSATATLSQGEYGVTGRILQNGTPVAQVSVEFADDTAPRQASTNPSGAYWFITLAPSTDYTLTFYQADNPSLTPPSEITSLAWLKGTLSGSGDIIELPDMEISINLSGNLFELLSPDDQASVSAAAISESNRIQFVWSSYNQNGSYHIELGSDGSDTPVWSTTQLTYNNLTWNGTLNDGSHITQGTYWWRVAVTKSLGNDILVVFTQPFDLIVTP